MSDEVKMKSSLVVITAVIMFTVFALFTPRTYACLDAKYTWEPKTQYLEFSTGDKITLNASVSTLNWNYTSEQYISLASVKWNFGDGTAEDYYGNATLSNATSGSLWTWTFRDGNISESMVVTHVFTQPGTFDVNLTITDVNGESKSWAPTFVINEGSTANEGFPWWIAGVVVVAGIGVALSVYFIKVKKPE